MLNPKDLINNRIIRYCQPLQLIIVLGISKSGKIIIARELSEKLNIPLFISDEFI